MNRWLLMFISLAYVGCLFAIAWYGDRLAGRAPARLGSGKRRALFYAMTLLVYTTAWSFYGSVGRAAERGIDFAAIYVGPTLVLVFGRSVLRKIIVTAKAQNATSIADFIAARYGKSQAVAAIVTIGAITALLPYIALQLKAVAVGYEFLLNGGQSSPGMMPPPWRDTAFAVTLVMALFSILFGVRHIHSSEHHSGLMSAIAFESAIKLAVFVMVASYIVFGIGNGFDQLLNPETTRIELAPLLDPPAWDGSWCATIILSAIAFLCLPHMFHVAVVENEDPSHVRTVAWMLPVYFVVLALFVLPIATVGLSRLRGIDADTFMLALPLAAGRSGVGLLAFVGGLSAATGMVIVAAVALSTMVCNDLIVPLLIGRGNWAPLPDVNMSRLLLGIRRGAVVVILLSAYCMYRLITPGTGLASMGLLSFAAVGQFGPALLGGLYWPRGNRAGAIGGLIVGLVTWGYTLLLPALFAAGSVPDWIVDGSLGIRWLAPTALFGLSGLDPEARAALCSLSLNVLAYVGISLVVRASAAERAQASAFVNQAVGSADVQGPQRLTKEGLRELRDLAGRFVGVEKGQRAFDAYLASVASPTRSDAVQFTERLLAGAIGAASARVIIAATIRGGAWSLAAAKGMLEEASAVIERNYELLHTALESVSQGICVFDQDLRAAAWNRRFLELCQFPEDLIQVGTPLTEMVRFNVQRQEYRSEDLRRLLVNQDLSRTAWPYVYERRRPDGVVLEIYFARMPNGGFVATYTDITERRRAAEALQAANESLESRVRERTLALAAAKAEAERANSSKSRFLAAASHDLLQPLDAARLFTSALTERLERPLTQLESRHRAEERELAANAHNSLRSVEQLLTTLLDISALDTGAVEPTVSDFPVGSLLSKLEVEFAVVAAARGLRFRVRGSDKVVRSDPRLLRRVLQNLLSNAIRYTSAGGVLLGCRQHGDRLRIEVWDTGRGIPQGQYRDIFQEFHRLHPRDTDERGLGLGLAIVERIAVMLGHPVDVRSQFGRGSMFSVVVPLGAAEGIPGETPVTAVPADPLTGLTVLCIDNEVGTLRGMRSLLEGWGCTVHCATSLADIKNNATRLEPAVALVDFHLDGPENGLSLIERLRRAYGRRLPALLVTADRSESVRASAHARECEVLYKPVKPGALRAYLQQVARLSKSEISEP